MSFISYAQNFEDVMLWRALKQIEKGLYIDVGAWSPDLDSVTRAFYERGWHGINIEPNPAFHQQLQSRRAHDINLQLAIGDQEETLSMNFLTNTGLSTLDDTIAQRHQQEGWEVERQPVHVTTLANILADHIPTGQEVHFLKVDCEGFEAAALRGNDWNKNRPWIVVVEATLPMSQEESYGDWEPILLNAGYHYAYFDGLNRFYVAREHSELLDAFKAPPNFFDDYVLYRQLEAEARVTQAEAKASDAEALAAQAEAKVESTSHEAKARETETRTQLQQALEVAQRAQEKSDQAEGRANEAEVKTQEAEALSEQYRTAMQELKARAEQAESSAAKANTKAQETKARETETRAQLQQALEVAQRMQEKSDQAEAGAKKADSKAQDAEVRAEQYRTEIKELKVRVEHVEKQAKEAKQQVQELTTQLAQHQAEAQALLQSKEQDLTKKQEELEQVHTHSQWLQNEWDVAKAKVDELNYSSHHWWAVADGRDKELQSVYHSKSWRITWPLRKLMQLLKWLFRLPVRLVIGVIRLPRKAASWFLTKCIVFVLRHKRFKRRARQWLNHHPKLEGHLRAFARVRGLLNGPISMPQESVATSLPEDDAKLTTRPYLQSQLEPYSGKKVAVLAPGAIDGTIGGAERFYSGLVAALCAKGCEVELVTLRVDETSFKTIQQGYKDFAELDLHDKDLVISTKAPTYVVNHPNHILYLVHTVRVFYDMFDTTFPDANEVLKAQRDLIHAEDTAALSRIQHRFSIGSEVSRRLVEWNGIDAEVLHPPLDLSELYDIGIGDYLYMPGRLHAWKRVDLAIQAIKRTTLPIRLVISGTGEAEFQLRELADDDPRIEFLGRVDDEQLKDLYAGAMAVPFLPIREDYGYVTLEAFASGKPVITCTDSGEPTAFVEHGVTGLVCEPEAQAICDAFEQLWNDRKLASRMGKAGRERISNITWESVTNRLLKAGFPEIEAAVVHPKPALKVTVLDMQPIIPAVGGGRLRLLGLYHDLGPGIETRYVGTYDWPGEKYRRHYITPSLEEIDVPLSDVHHQAAADAACKAGGKTVIDMLFSRQAQLSSEYLKVTMEAVQWADVVVFSHPWVAPLVDKQLLSEKLVIYDSHNVEGDLRSQLLDCNNAYEKSILDEVIHAERIAGDRADLVLACSEEDVDGFVSRYGWSRGKIRLMLNGVFSAKIMPADAEQKKASRQLFGVPEGAFVGFFIGSDYAPNLEAVQFIIEDLASELPEMLFVIAGGVCTRISANLPVNVRCVGFLEEDEKVHWLHASDCAINPMFSGSGTNIKMFDFMSAGLPVVTTSVGARGIAQKTSGGLLFAEEETFVQMIRKLLKERAKIYDMGQDNRRIVEKRFSWEIISSQLGIIIRSSHLRKQGNALLTSSNAASWLRVAHLSTVGLKCGIGEYTRKLIQVYQDHGISNLVLTARTPNEAPELTNINIDKKIVWFFDDVEWKNSKIEQRALQDVIDWGATHLIVQYHPGFYSPDALFEFVIKLKENGITVSVVLHNFIEESALVMRRLNELGVILFSHSITEVMQARALGVFLEQVPLGVDSSQFLKHRDISKRDWTKQPPIIITTGFLRRHKGTVILIRAMAEVIKRIPDAKLKIQCALYPSEDSRLELDTCKKEIDRLALQSSIILDAQFHEKEQIYYELAKADLAVLPYEKSNEGGSATATDCMAVGLPLLVSEAEIFDEIREVALSVKQSPSEIADAIVLTLSERELYRDLANRSYSYAFEHSWHNMAGVFIN